MRPTRLDTRSTILTSASSVLAANPGASMTEIATAAGVGRATLHRLFASRADLVRELALESMRACDEATAGIEARVSTATEALHEVVEALVPLGDRFHYLASMPEVYSDDDVAREYKRQQKELSELVDAVKAEGGIDPSIPTAWVVAVFDALIYAAWNAVDSGELARNDAPEHVRKTLMHGLARRP